MDTTIETLARDTPHAETDARLAAVEAVREVLDLVRPVAALIVGDRAAVIGYGDRRGDGPDDAPYCTLDDAPSFVVARVEEDEDYGSGCGDLRGDLFWMRADGSLWRGSIDGYYWSGCGGGRRWRVYDVRSASADDLATCADVRDVADTLLHTLNGRRGMRALAWRRQRIAKAREAARPVAEIVTAPPAVADVTALVASLGARRKALAFAAQRIGWEIVDVEIDLSAQTARVWARRGSRAVMLDVRQGRATIERWECGEVTKPVGRRGDRFNARVLTRDFLGRSKHDDAREGLRDFAGYLIANGNGETLAPGEILALQVHF